MHRHHSLHFRLALPAARIFSLLTILLGLGPAAATAQTPPLFPEFAVNSYTTGDQKASCAAIDGSGNFAVVWQSTSNPFRRSFDSNGVAGAAESAVATSGFPAQPRAATNSSGDSVVVWTGFDGVCCSDTFAQRFNSSGPVGSAFQVNTYTTGYQDKPSAAMDPSGNFVVVWQSHPNQDGAGYGIFGQRFDNPGAKVGGEFQVNTYTTGDQKSPSVAIDGSGKFVVVWQSDAQDGNKAGVFGQRFDAGATPQGAEFQVNIFTPNGQYSPRVASDAAGDFVVVWSTEPTDGSGYGVDGRRFNGSGTPISGEFRVNTYTFGNQTFPEVAMDSAGNFLVAWQSQGQDDPAAPSGIGIYAKQFGVSGRPAGAEFPVNTYTTGDQTRPSVALDDRGHFVITWQSNGQDGSGYGIFARRGGFPPPGAMTVDGRGGGGTISNANGVLEPGERVWVEPSWRNTGSSSLTLTGTASGLTGPAGATYTLDDASADYGTIPASTGRDCFTATGNCLQVSVSNPAARPSTHWDATLTESLSTGAPKTWTLHVGQSFPDVPPSNPFYKKIETMLHTGITSGCDPTHYCPTQAVPRSQMAIFLAKGITGGPAGLPEQGIASGKYYDCSLSGVSPLFTDVTVDDSFCRHVYLLAAQNVTLGCSATAYCPNDIVTRLQMAAFVAKSMVAPAGGAGVPLAYGPDPVTGLSYSCDAGSPNVHFTDVPATDAFCKHVHFLWAKGIVAGCAATLYCPSDPVTRDQMAKFLGNAFALQLYGP